MSGLSSDEIGGVLLELKPEVGIVLHAERLQTKRMMTVRRPGQMSAKVKSRKLDEHDEVVLKRRKHATSQHKAR